VTDPMRVYVPSTSSQLITAS